MSYSETLANGRNNSSEYEVAAATSLQELYEQELMYFVYKTVLDASEKRPTKIGKKVDIDSVSLIRAANRRVLESIGRGYLK